MVRLRLLFLALAFLTGPSPSAQSPSPLTLTLHPQIGYRPLTVTATVRIEPHYLNRGVCVVWESPVYSGAGCWQLEGQYARRTHTYTIKSLPAIGESTAYTVWAELITVRARHVTLSQPVQVLNTPF